MAGEAGDAGAGAGEAWVLVRMLGCGAVSQWIVRMATSMAAPAATERLCRPWPVSFPTSTAARAIFPLDSSLTMSAPPLARVIALGPLQGFCSQDIGDFPDLEEDDCVVLDGVSDSGR